MTTFESMAMPYVWRRQFTTALYTMDVGFPIIGAMTHDGIIATDFHTGSVDGDAFAAFVRGSLIPQMQGFDGVAERSIVVMDNCSVHHTEAVTDLFREAGVFSFNFTTTASTSSTLF